MCRATHMNHPLQHPMPAILNSVRYLLFVLFILHRHRLPALLPVDHIHGRRERETRMREHMHRPTQQNTELRTNSKKKKKRIQYTHFYKAFHMYQCTEHSPSVYAIYIYFCPFSYIYGTCLEKQIPLIDFNWL